VEGKLFFVRFTRLWKLESSSWYAESVMNEGAAKLRWARGGGAQRPAVQVSELKKTGARSARARRRGQNPLVSNRKV
jgi:hypothetical protein